MTKKAKFAVESPPKTGTITIEEDQDNIKVSLKPKPGQDMIYDESGTFSYGVRPRTEVVLPDNPTTPEEELRRSKKILQPEENELTIGDLSIPTEQKSSPERVRKTLRNIGVPGATVGDISVATDKKQSIEAQAEAALAGKDENLSVGDLYRGPCQSESQKLAADHIRKHQEKVAEVQRIKKLMFEQEQGAT